MRFVANWGGYLFWYYKRFTRIAIPYSLLFIPFYILFHFADGLEWSNVIADYTTLTYWTNHRGFWYIAMLVPLYLLTPLLQILTDKGFRSLLKFLLVLIIVIMGPSDLDISNFRPNVLSDNIWFVVIRIPAYLFGYCLGPYIKGHREVSLIPIAALIIVISIMLRFHHFGPLYSYWMMWMPLAAIVIIVSLILNSKDNKCIGIFLSFIGGISLESYISNGLMMKAMMVVPSNVYDSSIFEGNYLRYGTVIIVGFMLSLLTNRISKYIKNYL